MKMNRLDIKPIKSTAKIKKRCFGS